MAEMRQLLADPEFLRNAIETTTASLWHMAACFAFADGTVIPDDLYNVCTEYRPANFNAREVPDVYKMLGKTAPSISSIDLTIEDAP